MSDRRTLDTLLREAGITSDFLDTYAPQPRPPLRPPRRPLDAPSNTPRDGEYGYRAPGPPLTDTDRAYNMAGAMGSLAPGAMPWVGHRASDAPAMAQASGEALAEVTSVPMLIRSADAARRSYEGFRSGDPARGFDYAAEAVTEPAVAGLFGAGAARLLAPARRMRDLTAREPAPPQDVTPHAWEQFGTNPDGIRVYHGSPHAFDRFDAAKIGTGEGHQSFGHGLYFAENPRVGEVYRDQLAGPEGYLYEVRIDAAPGEFLDISLPLSQQSPYVRQRIQHANKPQQIAFGEGMGVWVLPDGVTRIYETPRMFGGPSRFEMHAFGRRLGTYDSLDDAVRDAGPGITNPAGGDAMMAFGHGQRASDSLRRLGVAGVRYPDAGSRGVNAENPTYNYVLFDPDRATITNRAGGPPAPSPPPLDLSPSARMARAREMGFDVDTPLYHGTDRDVGSFDLARAGERPMRRHINRIATLAREGWDDPILLENNGAGIYDGSHRLAAAIARGDDTVRVMRESAAPPAPRDDAPNALAQNLARSLLDDAGGDAERAIEMTLDPAHATNRAMEAARNILAAQHPNPNRAPFPAPLPPRATDAEIQARMAGARRQSRAAILRGERLDRDMSRRFEEGAGRGVGSNAAPSLQMVAERPDMRAYQFAAADGEQYRVVIRQAPDGEWGVTFQAASGEPWVHRGDSATGKAVDVYRNVIAAIQSDARTFGAQRYTLGGLDDEFRRLHRSLAERAGRLGEIPNGYAMRADDLGQVVLERSAPDGEPQAPPIGGTPKARRGSLFAAFDPAKRDSNDLLAGLAPVGVGAAFAAHQGTPRSQGRVRPPIRRPARAQR